MKKNKLKNYHSIDNVFAFKKDSIDNSRMIGEEIEPFYSE